MPCLGNRYDLAGEIDRRGLDQQGTSPCCLVEALEEGHLAARRETMRLPDKNRLISHRSPRTLHHETSRRHDRCRHLPVTRSRSFPRTLPGRAATPFVPR